MKKVVTFCFILSCLLSYSQKKETFNDRAELERITNAINLSGQKLNKSAQQQINGLIVAGLGSVTSIVGGLIQNTDVIYGGALVSTVSIPFFISSIINKKKSGLILMDFELNEKSIKNHKDSVGNIKPKNIEPKYKLGQTVYFYKGGKYIEAKILLITDTVGLRIEYFDSEKNKTKDKFVSFDRILVKKP